MIRKAALLGTALATLAACSATVPARQPAPMLAGPPVQTLTTPYDDALACLARTRIPGRQYTLAVGDVADRTGRISVENGGTGNFVTQGAGDIISSALVKAGIVGLVERLDTRVPLFEQMQADKRALGDGVTQTIRTPEGEVREIRYRAMPEGMIRGSDFYILGSINTLDFGVSSGGGEVIVAGIGARARQFRAVVGLDLRLVHTPSTRVVSAVSLQKQIVGQEVGAGIGRFFGNYLVEVDLGDKKNEPMQMAMRSMLQLAVFDLLTDLYDIEGCREGIDALEQTGAVTDSGGDASPTASAQVPDGAPATRPEAPPAL